MKHFNYKIVLLKYLLSNLIWFGSPSEGYMACEMGFLLSSYAAKMQHVALQSEVKCSEGERNTALKSLNFRTVVATDL